ncbi:fibronectin type III domain-containing protein [Mobiluncus mulieris]|uniref:Fibronectin type III domain-containing protein n=1 Tax=Mobiluncus mulieris TaxID=2052 RepID=A0A7Y0U383_9ACTO|nr:fibronectin type III domain-containing protein [Mobiluncus mulieris]NMW65977.1 fibronectin type III domain-containing protein [Mobiluncus mulieris]
MIEKLRIVAYDVWGDRRGVVPAVSEISVVQPLNGIPTGDLVVAAQGINAGLLALPCEVGVEAWDGAAWVEYPGMRFLILGSDAKLEDGSVLSLKMTGIAAALDWATVWEETPGDADCKRIFPAQPPGQILHALLAAAQTRRDVTGLAWFPTLTWNFSGRHDSVGQAWPRNARCTFNRSDTLGKVVEWLAEKGAIDWRMNRRRLEVYVAGTRMARRRDDIRLRKAFSTSLPVSESWQEITTVARFAGDEGFLVEQASPEAVRSLGRVERWSEQGNVKLKQTARLYLDALLKPGARPAVEYRREWAAGAHVSQPYPWQDYNLGDWVPIDPYKDDIELRVVEIQLKQDAQGQITGAEVLGTRIQSLVEKLARRTTDLSSGQMGGENGKPASIEQREGDPLTSIPTGLVVTVTQTEGHRGAGQASWQPCEGAVEYELQTYDDGRWGTLRITQDTGVEFPTRNSGEVTVRVRGLDQQGRGGGWCPPVTVKVDTSEVIIPRPTRLTLDSRLGIITTEWDGRALSPDGYPCGLPWNVDRLEIAATTSSASPAYSTPISKTQLRRGGVAPLGGLQAGTQVWVWSRIVDRNGKPGAWQQSTPSSILVRRVEASDLDANNISANTAVMGILTAGIAKILQLEAGEISGVVAQFVKAIIKQLDVEDANIDKLFAMLFEAHKITADMLSVAYAEIDTLRVGGYKIDPEALRNMGTINNPVDYGSTSMDGNSFNVGSSRLTSDELNVGSSRLTSDELNVGAVKINSWGNGWIPRCDAERFATEMLSLGEQNGNSISGRYSISYDGWQGVYCNTTFKAGGLASESTIYASGAVMASDFVKNSSRASKYDPEPVRDLTAIMRVEPVAYRPQALMDRWRQQFGEAGPSRPVKPLPERQAGWVAEDLEAAGLGIFVKHGEDGEILGVEYDAIPVALWQVLRKQQAQIEALEQRLAAAESGVRS